MKRSFCEGCFQKQRKIDELTEEVKRLKLKLRYQERKEAEGFFGSSTPSSKIPVKPNTPLEKAKKKKGAKPGHKGVGRNGFSEEEAEKVIDIEIEEHCPVCGNFLEDKGIKCRSVLESRPVKAERIVYRLHKRYCPHCGKSFTAAPPSVLPKSLYGNQLIANAATMHYLYGIPIGRVCALIGIGPGSLVEIFHRLERLFSSAPEKLIEEYRKSPVKHADETGWRNNGQSGYAWLFATKELSIFQFKKTRSSTVPKTIFGEEKLPGVLVVDRYNAYNKSPCKIQYCYAHLLRAVQDLEKEFPNSTEVKAFLATLAPLLASAMGLRNQKINDKTFYKKATELKKQIKKVVNSEARHLGIRKIQDIFRDNESRLYHWANDRQVPADNNLAERNLRPTVIARKTSFGSQSDAGAHTRGVLMTILHTLNKQNKDTTARLKLVLDKLSDNPNQDPFPLLFPRASPRN